MTFRACTIVARNYLAQAQVLAASFAAHHPHIEFATLVIDGEVEDRGFAGVGQVVLPDDLGLESRELHQMMVMYDVMELATALKPALLMHLVRSGATAVAYFDPDMRVYAALDDVFEQARDRIVLTPHVLDPMPRDGRSLTETQIMQSGIYNLGFIAVGSGCYSFLVWWHDRLRSDAVVDVAQGLFTDQRWIDWVPALFPHVVLRDRGFNVAYWNLHERPIVGFGDRATAGGDPLRLFHFSGYDPAKPWVLSKHLGDNPRVVLSSSPDLDRLCADYGAELLRAGHLERRRAAYRLDRLPNGFELPWWIRRLYREVVVGSLRTPDPPPDPVESPEAWLRWLMTPAFFGAKASFAVAEYGVWRMRSDLQQAFPDVLGVDSADFRRWLDVAGTELGTLRAHAPAAPEETGGPALATRRRAFGWSVLAYAASELGVGEAGRRLALAVQQSGLPTELVAVPTANRSRQNHRPRQSVRQSIGYENAISCVNADELPRLHQVMDLGALRGSRIGLWFWELETFPARFRGAFDLVDEVWVASEFARAAIQEVTDVPVRTIPLPMPAMRAPTRFTRRSLGLPEDKHVFLTNFDYLSTYERKNPIGAIRAYTEAFGPSDGACLVVKSINGHLRALDVEAVRLHAGRRPDILFLDHYVSSAAMQAMIELSDTYVSLHRSEGYGLNLADAMVRGTPVVATGYSGNMAFMDSDTAALVGFDLVEVGPDAAPYDATARWADPDLAEASAAMVRLFSDPAHAAALARRAQESTRRFGLAEVGAEIRDALVPELAALGGAS